MSYESTAEPIKLGYLFDFVLPDGFPQDMRADLTDTFDIVFEEGLRQGVIDRPVDIVFREVEGLPKGTVKAVIDAYGELVDEGCLAVFGPSITDNCVPTREAIEERFHVPAISVTGSGGMRPSSGFARYFAAISVIPRAIAAASAYTCFAVRAARVSFARPSGPRIANVVFSTLPDRPSINPALNWSSASSS